MTHDNVPREDALKTAIAVLGDCAARGVLLNPDSDKRHFFTGYRKACDDIARMVIEAAFQGRPLPTRARANTHSPE